MGNNKTCGCCDVAKSTAQFYKSPVDGSLLPVCKNCCRRRLKEYQETVDSASGAMWLILANLGVPFLSDVYNKTELNTVNAGPNTDMIMAYLKALAEDGRKVQGFWESDKMLDQLTDGNVDRNEKVRIDWQSEFNKWGKFVDDSGNVDEDAYSYLNAKMEEYTGNLELTKPAQINRYRDLCKAELRKIRLEEMPDVQQKDISAATTEILTLMKLLKIDNFQSDSRTDVEKTLEYQMAMMEKTKPVEDEDITKYRDFCGFYNLEQQLMRPLRNVIAGTKDYPALSKEE